VLIGSSAGGQLVTLLANRNGPNSTARVAAVVNFYGPTILHVGDEDDERIQEMLGCVNYRINGTACHQRAIDASPQTHVKASNPPILTFFGTSDGGFPAAPLFQAKGEAVGADYTLIAVSCIKHCHDKTTMLASTTYGRSNVDVMYDWIDHHVGRTSSPGISTGTHASPSDGLLSPSSPPIGRRLSEGTSSSCMQAAYGACAPWTLSTGCLSCIYAAWATSELSDAGCKPEDAAYLQALCLSPSEGVGTDCAQTMYDSCAPYDAGAPCQTCAEEYLGAKCTAELVDDMCELPSPALLVALHGSAANEHVVRCARDLVEACAWGTDRAACTSCGTSTVLPQPGSSCTAEHLNAVCKLASDDLADVMKTSTTPPSSSPATPPACTDMLGLVLQKLEQQSEELKALRREVSALKLPAVNWGCALGPEHASCRCSYQFEAGSNSPSAVDVTCHD